MIYANTAYNLFYCSRSCHADASFKQEGPLTVFADPAEYKAATGHTIMAEVCEHCHKKFITEGLIDDPNGAVGNSLPYCVKDILAGELYINRVKVIRCSFKKPLNKYNYIVDVVDRYNKTYWKGRGSEIAEYLWNEAKLEFTGGHYLPTGGVWGNYELQLVK